MVIDALESATYPEGLSSGTSGVRKLMEDLAVLVDLEKSCPIGGSSVTIVNFGELFVGYSCQVGTSIAQNARTDLGSNADRRGLADGAGSAWPAQSEISRRLHAVRDVVALDLRRRTVDGTDSAGVGGGTRRTPGG